jgi:hypothetical protein
VPDGERRWGDHNTDARPLPVTDCGSPAYHRFTARGRLDEEVHLVNALVDAVTFPTAYRTWCGQTVVEICKDGRPATCPGCAKADGAAPTSSSTSGREQRRGERAW